jgi:outer membrane lipoprotein-sorting protein
VHILKTSLSKETARGVICPAHFRTIKSTRYFFAAGIICCLALWSCALPVIKPTSAIPPYIDTDEALRLIVDAQKKITDLKGTVTLRLYDQQHTLVNSVTGYLAMKFPDKVRFSYIGPLGMVLFEALVNDNTTILFLPQQLLAYKGKTDVPSAGPFSPSLLKAPFSKPAGDIFIIEHSGEKSILTGIAHTKDTYALSEKITIDRTNMRPIIREQYRDGLVIQRVTYDAYEVIDGTLLPTNITIQDLASGNELTLTLSDAQVNTGISDEPFDTTVRSPYTEHPLASFAPPEF